MADKDPFEALEITATLEVAQVKRAYFALLQRHPPHTDPEGFRRIRAAYEALMSPGARGLAYATAPIGAAEELARWHGRWDAPMQQALSHFNEASARATAIESFVARVSRTTLSGAAAMFGAPGLAGEGDGGDG